MLGMILTGDILCAALKRSSRLVALLDACGNRTGEVSPDQAAVMLKIGTQEYEVIGTKRKVRYIRVLARPVGPTRITRRELPFVPCWRNQQAAVLSHWASQQSPGVEARTA